MTLKVRDATTQRIVTTFKVRDAGSVVRTIAAIKVRDATGLRQVFNGVVFSVMASPDYVYGAGVSAPPSTVSTRPTTAFVTGGRSPFTYAWTGSGSLTATSPTTATTAFRGNPPFGSTYTGSFICTVTDARGMTAVSNAVSAEAERQDL